MKRDATMWTAFAIFILIATFGAYDYWRALPPRPVHARLFGEAYMVALALGFHFRFAHDRGTGFDDFVASNFAGSWDLYLGKVVAGLFVLTLFAAVSFVYLLVTALGDLAFSVRYVWMFFIISLMIAPMAVLFELVIPSRYPVLLLLLFFSVFSVIYRKLGDMERFVEVTGIDGRYSAPEVAFRLAMSLAGVFLLYPLYRFRLRR